MCACLHIAADILKKPDKAEDFRAVKFVELV